MNMYKFFSPGDVIGGYCNGFFGRDDYEKKTCVMVTEKYAVFTYKDGGASVLNFSKRLIEKEVDEWKKEGAEPGGCE